MTLSTSGNFLPPGLHCSVGNLSGPDSGHRKFEVAGGAKNAVRAAILSEGSEVHAALSAQ